MKQVLIFFLKTFKDGIESLLFSLLIMIIMIIYISLIFGSILGPLVMGFDYHNWWWCLTYIITIPLLAKIE